jgi:hypothetical protein
MKRKVVGFCKNNWRKRNITLYEFDEKSVFSIGVSFDSKIMVVALEERAEHANTLSCFPETYIHE